jgi:hypothetical protein
MVPEPCERWYRVLMRVRSRAHLARLVTWQTSPGGAIVNGFHLARSALECACEAPLWRTCHSIAVMSLSCRLYHGHGACIPRQCGPWGGGEPRALRPQAPCQSGATHTHSKALRASWFARETRHAGIAVRLTRHFAVAFSICHPDSPPHAGPALPGLNQFGSTGFKASAQMA